MIKTGLYRIKTPYVFDEKHGGGKIIHRSYTFLCFYEKESFAGYYESGKDDNRRFMKKDFDYKGVYSLLGKEIKIIINDPFLKEKIFFEGKLIGENLIIKRYRENNKKDILTEVYEYLEEEKTFHK